MASNVPSREHLAGKLASQPHKAAGDRPGIDVMEGLRKDRRAKGTLLPAYSLFPVLQSLQLPFSPLPHSPDQSCTPLQLRVRKGRCRCKCAHPRTDMPTSSTATETPLGNKYSVLCVGLAVEKFQVSKIFQQVLPGTG